MTYILYNPLAGTGNCRSRAEEMAKRLKLDRPEMRDVTCTNVSVLVKNLAPSDEIYLVGGDGTLNHFANAVENNVPRQKIWYYPAGTGNDFMADLGKAGDTPVCINAYLQNLPRVQVQGKTRLFLNGVGYGIDGYCCETGDALKARGETKVNYTAIAIKGLLFHYKPTNAVITVDGVRHKFKKVWLAPTMFGRHYGGGMMPTPDQDRSDPSRKLSVMVYYGVGKLKALMVFPSVFQGKHVEHREMVSVRTGHDITVEFDRPTPLQVDGETILDVKSYHAVGVPVRETANV